MNFRKSKMDHIIDSLLQQLSGLEFEDPVKYVYNPMVYARAPFNAYHRKYGVGLKEVVLLGMNPGPWGMVQTGVPFGDVEMVKGWLGIAGKVDSPMEQHPKRPIQGFQCTRGEVSGKRLWGWARDRFGDPRHFFRKFWVANYCPLVFMEESGRNRTPDKLKKGEKIELFKACDQALVHMVELYKPRYVIGIGNFAYQRATGALSEIEVKVGRISHPSPANPKANKGWAELIEGELTDIL
jgi:single-strand selective monofunctional uracil DNA glycosylase